MSHCKGCQDFFYLSDIYLMTGKAVEETLTAYYIFKVIGQRYMEAQPYCTPSALFSSLVLWTRLMRTSIRQSQGSEKRHLMEAKVSQLPTHHPQIEMSLKLEDEGVTAAFTDVSFQPLITFNLSSKVSAICNLLSIIWNCYDPNHIIAMFPKSWH